MRRSVSFVISMLILGALGIRSALADAVTAERIAALAEAEREAWTAYLERSRAAARRDRAAIDAELQIIGAPRMVGAVTNRGFVRRLRRGDAWYAGEEARQLAENVLTFQTPAGGWGKNIEMGEQPRAVGQSFAEGESWHYVGTFDNGATTGQIEFLGRVAAARDPSAARKGFLRGLDYMLAAQYPNGGFPQVYPIEGGYHDNITYNDGAMARILGVLRDVADGDYAFVSDEKRAEARAALRRGIDCMLKTQVVQNGTPTVWCAQHDPLTLAPTIGRSYEWPSLSGGESADVALFLMGLDDPTPEIDAAIEHAAAWFNANAIYGYRYDFRGLRLVESDGAGPLWARFYELGTGKPMFVARNAETALYDVSQLPSESNGYAWYVSTGESLLEAYPGWRERVGAAKQ
jgi:PelA/Pel-15E family pectate lyase